MNKILCICLMFILTAGHAAYAQKNINGLVSAEEDFARHAVEHSTKEAFLRFADSTGVVFNKGKIMNAWERWRDAKESPDKLIWHPVYSGISASGDLGFNTGPWVYKHSLQDTALAWGEFATVWQFKAGKWKFLADLGISYPGTGKDSTAGAARKWIGKQPYSSAGADSVLETDKSFILRFEEQGPDAYRQSIDDNTWFNIQGYPPFSRKNAVERSLSLIPAGVHFIPVHGGIAASNDLLYVYGIVQYQEKEENYLRVWRKTDKGYTLILQVLKW